MAHLADFADWGFLALRIVIAVILIVRGWPKIAGASRWRRRSRRTQRVDGDDAHQGVIEGGRPAQSVTDSK